MVYWNASFNLINMYLPFFLMFKSFLPQLSEIQLRGLSIDLVRIFLCWGRFQSNQMQRNILKSISNNRWVQKICSYITDFPQNTTSSAVIGAAVKATVIKIGNSVVALYGMSGRRWPPRGASPQWTTIAVSPSTIRCRLIDCSNAILILCYWMPICILWSHDRKLFLVLIVEDLIKKNSVWLVTWSWTYNLALRVIFSHDGKKLI